MTFIKCPNILCDVRDLPNGGITKISCCDIRFLRVDFSNIIKIKKDLELYDSHQDVQLSLDDRQDLYTSYIIKDSTLCPPEIDNGSNVTVLDSGNMSITKAYLKNKDRCQSKSAELEVRPSIHDLTP